MSMTDFRSPHPHERRNTNSSVFRRTSQLLHDAHAGWKLGLPAHVNVPATDLPTFIAVGGGKGGVGKSILSANLSAKLAAHGYRVLVVDLDLGCANLHTYFGIPKPELSLSDFILKGQKSFAEIIMPTTINEVALVAGGQEASWGRHLARGPEALNILWTAFLRCKQEMQVDFIIMDLGAGTLRHTMDFFATAHLGIITVLPEPTSLENAYVFLKSHIWHIIDNVAQRTGHVDAAQDLRTALSNVGTSAGAGTLGYTDCFRRMASAYPEYISEVIAALNGRAIGLVVNQVRSQADIDIGSSMEIITKRYFGIHSHYLGHLNYDDAAWKSLRNRRLLLADFPHSILSKCLSKIANNGLQTLGF